MNSDYIDFNEIKKLSYSSLVTHHEQLLQHSSHAAEDLRDSTGSIVYNILSHYVHGGKKVYVSGILDMVSAFGVLRDRIVNFTSTMYDIHVSTKIIEEYGLKVGDEVGGIIEPPRSTNSKLFTLKEVITVNGIKVNARTLRYRQDFTAPSSEALYPEKPIKLENEGLTGRIIDIVAPIGFGQRTLIVAPPKVGKTTILRDIAKAIVINYNINSNIETNVHLIVLLVGERPEEVTLTKKEVPCAEVLSSTFDETAEQQIKVAELCMERAKRLAEMGKDVVLIVDSMSRLVRAYNYIAPASGKVLSGGVETYSLYKIRHFFGIARKVAGAGSITIIASCLVSTNSRMDEFVFEELKGTGNSEVYLDQKLAEARKFPAIDILTSSTRRPESFLPKTHVRKISLVMSHLVHRPANGSSSEKYSTEHAYKVLVKTLETYKTNNEMFENFNLA